MIQCLIIEDEIVTARRLERMLQKADADLEVMAMLPTIRESVHWLRNNIAPDLIFLDIHLSDGNSFEIFREVDIASAVIFTTAYDEYALRAFKVNSIDYLLKPVEPHALEQSLQKFRKVKFTAPVTGVVELLKQLRDNRRIYRERYLINFRETLLTISLREIAYFVSEQKNTFLINRKGEKFLLEYTLEEVEQELNPEIFFRITRQYIISLDAIGKIHTYFNGRLKIGLIPPVREEILISREKSLAFKVWLNR